MDSRDCWLVFDFDGTLVDSARGILASMAATLADHRIAPRVELRAEIVGPPLLETLRQISGEEDAAALAALAADFKRSYDNAGYRDTDPYPGVHNALFELGQAGFRLEIATNKRGLPTRKILDHLGWSRLFAGVHCLDECVGCPDKAAVLGRLIAERRLTAASTLYIGDTDADAAAAAANGMPFLRAGWGYGGAHDLDGQTTCTDPKDLPAAVREIVSRFLPCPAS